MSYKNLEIWQLAKEVTIEVHQMTLSELPKFELYEVGSQIRRSAKSIRANIVEGYGRKTYQAEFFKHIVYSIASNDETKDHLDVLYETKSLKNEILYSDLKNKLETLGRKLYLFRDAVEKNLSSSKIR